MTRAIPGCMGLKGSRARGGGQAFEAQRGRQGHGERPAPEGQRGLRVETEKTARTEPMALTAREGRRAPVAGPVRRDLKGRRGRRVRGGREAGRDRVGRRGLQAPVATITKKGKIE